MKNRKSLGQHWLKNRGILLEIAELSYVKGVTTVLEIGPGLGTLTSALFKFFDKVIAVELDKNLADNLPKSFPGKKLEVVNDDILDLDMSFLPENYVIAGNIPYYITSPILRKILEADNKAKKIVLLVQKEVAQRLAADKGDHSILSLATQAYGSVKLGPLVARTEFSPPPKVDSQVIMIEPYAKPLADESTIGFLKKGFKMPRKKLSSNLAGFNGYSKNSVEDLLDGIGLNKNARPADLGLEDWQKLEKTLHKR